MWLCVFGRVASDVSEDIRVFFKVLRLLDLEDEGNTILRKAGNRYPIDRISYCNCCKNLKPHNYLPLAQCKIPEETNLRERL
jgi:hypothetical protein